MIIKDINGERLSLTSVRLIENGHDDHFLNLADISPLVSQKTRDMVTIWTKKLYPRATFSALPPHRISVSVHIGYVLGNPSLFKIGCHKFDRKTFALILRTAREARKRLNARTK